MSKSKYVLTKTNNSLGNDLSNYTDGEITSNNQELQLGICGTYYMHVIVTDALGNTSTEVSSAMSGVNVDSRTIGVVKDFVYKGAYERYPIPFDGVYKLEV